ncbi:MAG TPA: tetratricopeptide repeat protein [Bdellovibrionota bacterium]|nr:tetratricopeptide repeat protein [Bdellovibrionota bacterium]
MKRAGFRRDGILSTFVNVPPSRHPRVSFRGRHAWTILTILSCFLWGCSTKLPAKGVEAFDRCNYDQAIETFQEKVKEGGKDYVLYNLALLSAAMRAGKYDLAEKAALDAQRVMWSDAGKERGTASLVSAEAIKVFKGEPFEKAMAMIYPGILYFNRGDYDNARAAFSKAVLAIKQKEKNREDFALAYVLEAKVALKMGELDNARIALEKAKARYANNSLFEVEKLKKNNTIFLVEMGKAPRKIRKGPGGSLDDWQRRDYPERSASIFVDDVEIGKTTEVADLTTQAKTQGRTGKDAVQVTKGVARDAAIATTVIAADQAARGNKTAGWVALGAGLFAVANQSQADVRQWELLPDLLQVQFAQLSPGEHRVRVVFYNASGRALPGEEQVWYTDTGSENPDRIFVFHSSPCQRTGRLENTETKGGGS